MSEDLQYADARELLGRLAAVAEQIVLVGGQAVNFWAERYLSRNPELALSGPFVSKDVDFCGTAQLARECARLLAGSCKIPSLDDRTPCTAVVQYDDGGRRRQIDFLGSPYGLRPDDVRASSILVRVQTNTGEVKFRVMHPLHCLQSRTQNVYGLPGYDSERSLRQLRASIVCAREFGAELLEQGKTRDTLRLNERIFTFARSEPALAVWSRHQISVFSAVLVDKRLPERFIDTRFPQMAQAIEAAHEKALGRAGKQEEWIFDGMEVRGTTLVAKLRSLDGRQRELASDGDGMGNIGEGDVVRVGVSGSLELVRRGPEHERSR